MIRRNRHSTGLGTVLEEKMKYLVEVNVRDVSGGSAEDFVGVATAAKEYLQGLIDAGQLDCSYFVGYSGRGVAIGNADSHEELMANLQGYPTAPFLKFEVYPLVDFAAGWDIIIKDFQNRAAAMSG